MHGLEEQIGYKFSNKELLTTALTHSSYSNESRRHGVECNERLEFLGDAVLGAIVAEYLYKRFPRMSEGTMTRLRADMVCEKNLAVAAEKIKLGMYLLIGKGEEHNGGRIRSSILADAMEAVIAALFLDGGYEAAKGFIRKLILEPFEASDKVPDVDRKTALQELVQKKSNQVLEYRLVGESGPDHAKTFTVMVVLNGKPVSKGEGKSKKDAEQDAARHAIEVLS